MARNPEMTRAIREILTDTARLSVDVEQLSDQDDLFHAGMTSHANVNLMLALEEKYDVEFPPEMLQRATFASVEAISDALTVLLGATVPS